MTGIPTQVNFNIPDLFKDAFGLYVRFPIYVLGKSKPGTPPDVKMEDWQMSQFVSEPGDKTPYLGNQKPSNTVVWDQFGFGHPDFARDNQQPQYYMPLVTTVEFSQPKNVVKTPLIGNSGTIKGTAKELMSEDDTIITFRGLAINFNNPNQYPEDEVIALNKLFALNESLPVYSKLMSMHGIDNIVFTNREFPALEGFANVQPFEFTALSDNPIILELA